MHIYIDIYIDTDICTCLYRDICIYICTCEYIYIYVSINVSRSHAGLRKSSIVWVYTCSSKNLHIYLWIYMYRYIYIYLHICIYICIYSYLYICIHVRSHAQVGLQMHLPGTCVYIYTYTHINAYTYIYRCIYKLKSGQFFTCKGPWKPRTYTKIHTHSHSNTKQQFMWIDQKKSLLHNVDHEKWSDIRELCRYVKDTSKNAF